MNYQGLDVAFVDDKTLVMTGVNSEIYHYTIVERVGKVSRLEMRTMYEDPSWSYSPTHTLDVRSDKIMTVYTRNPSAYTVTYRLPTLDPMYY